FNAIEGYAFKGYFKLDGPPGKVKSLITTQKVMYNMLQAHAQVYQAIKEKRGIFLGNNGLYEQYKTKNSSIPELKIGIQKKMILLEIKNGNYFYAEHYIPFVNLLKKVIQLLDTHPGHLTIIMNGHHKINQIPMIGHTASFM